MEMQSNLSNDTSFNKVKDTPKGRPLLEAQKIGENALKAMQNFHQSTRQEVIEAVQENEWVIVGMAQNPVVKQSLKTMRRLNIPFKYLEYGSYVSAWKKRLSIKLWSGWPTFPQVFYKGVLLGGNKELQEFLSTKK